MRMLLLCDSNDLSNGLSGVYELIVYYCKIQNECRLRTDSSRIKYQQQSAKALGNRKNFHKGNMRARHLLLKRNNYLAQEDDSPRLPVNADPLRFSCRLVLRRLKTLRGL